jgi:hypothetical protein
VIPTFQAFEELQYEHCRVLLISFERRQTQKKKRRESDEMISGAPKPLRTGPSPPQIEIMAVKQSSRMFRKLNHSTNVSDDFFWQKENRNMSIVQHTRRLWIQTYLSATGGHRNIAETLNVFQTPTALWSSPGISLMVSRVPLMHALNNLTSGSIV